LEVPELNLLMAVFSLSRQIPLQCLKTIKDHGRNIGCKVVQTNESKVLMHICTYMYVYSL